VSSQTVLKSAQTKNRGDEPDRTPPAYNPYPAGILPADLNSEIARVQREVDVVETEALGQWHALTPPILTGQPPTLQNTGVQSVEILGKLMNFDRNISVFHNQACSFCHMPYAAFSGPIPSVNLTMIAYPGSFHFRANKRTAQRYTYAPYFPTLQGLERQPARSGKSNDSKSRAGTDHPRAGDRVGEVFDDYQVDDKQSRWLARALRNRALWYGSKRPEPDRQISDQVEPGPLIDGFPRADGQP
jgi:hypothetical protein